MQTVIQVWSTNSASLRDRILKDKKLEEFGITVTKQLDPGRSRGWSKLHGTSSQDGALNIEWIPSAKLLLCRVVTKGTGDPAPLAGDFLRFLLSRFHRQILGILIRPGE